MNPPCCNRGARRPRPIVALLMLALLGPASALAAPVHVASPPIAAGGAELENTRQFDLTSRINGEAYRIQVSIPRGKAPAAGYPVLYILDGNVLFGTFAGAVRNRSQAGEIERAVVVGIASGEGPQRADRTLDFTPSDMASDEKPIIKDLGPDSRFGGAEAFENVIATEIRPRVAEVVAIDERRSTLFGWSLGGLFVLHTLFNHPDAFQSYVALSPSIWRNHKAVLGDMRRLAGRTGPPPRLFLAVGGLEEAPPRGDLIAGASKAEIAAELRYGRMVGNVRDLGRQLQAQDPQTVVPQVQVFDGETHNSVPWRAVNPILSYLFPAPLTSHQYCRSAMRSAQRARLKSSRVGGTVNCCEERE